MRKRFFVVALALVAIASFNAQRAAAQSCPNMEAFGVRQAHPVDGSVQSRYEVAYFTTDDPNAFMSERAGLSRSGSYVSMNAVQFTARLNQLERSGVASVMKQQSATSFLGETAQMNLERNPADARMVNASFSSHNANNIFGLNRESEVSVYKGSSLDGDYYRVRLISWFVDVTPRGAQKIVDYDASVLLKPGQTAVFKLTSNYEMRRTGSSRSYMAVTLNSVDRVGLAQLAHARSSSR